MASNMSDWQQWILENLADLSKRYGKDGVVLNGKTWRSILIFYYALPPGWNRKTSRLLIVLPKQSDIFYAPPDRFYLDKGLRAIDGKTPPHYFEDVGFNDLAKQGLARFSFHLNKGWHPSRQCSSGTTLIDAITALYHGLESAIREGK